MSTKKEQSIHDYESSFTRMANLVLHQLGLIEKVMLSTDAGDQGRLIDEINANEKEIDRLEVVISDKFINAIVLYQPLASDLRKLVAIYRMSINVERIGDLVMNMAYAIESICKSEEYIFMSDVILNMFQSGRLMVEKSLLSFVNADQDFAVWTIKNDSVVDEMNNKLLSNTIARSAMDRKTKNMLLSYIDIKNIISNIERIADHATNIAEATIYSLRGTDIRHSGFEKSDTQE
ncbi:MAG TPA: PhoU domain-containing protein [Bacteroidales bacterium]|nr:PhoU domain-containing protein [Bacteroidales bacterium]